MRTAPFCPSTPDNPTGCSCNANCTNGCLYELTSDPTEHVELSAKYPERTAALIQRFEELKESAFLPVRCTGCDDGWGNVACGKSINGVACDDPRACEMATGEYGGFCERH